MVGGDKQCDRELSQRWRQCRGECAWPEGSRVNYGCVEAAATTRRGTDDDAGHGRCADGDHGAAQPCLPTDHLLQPCPGISTTTDDHELWLWRSLDDNDDHGVWRRGIRGDATALRACALHRPHHDLCCPCPHLHGTCAYGYLRGAHALRPTCVRAAYDDVYATAGRRSTTPSLHHLQSHVLVSFCSHVLISLCVHHYSVSLSFGCKTALAGFLETCLFGDCQFAVQSPRSLIPTACLKLPSVLGYLCVLPVRHHLSPQAARKDDLTHASPCFASLVPFLCF